MRCYHTTPIYYVNAVPHVGHAYTTIAADALTRARRLMGHQAFMLTGTDEHGQNIERIARERGIPEQQHCDEIAARFRSLFERLDVGDGRFLRPEDADWQRPDARGTRFIRTTDALHKDGVLALWKRLKAARTPSGESAVYSGTYSGFYCPRCEGFKDEEDLRQPGNLCGDHELPCEWTQEENFFFRLSAYADWLRARITSDPEHDPDHIQIDPEVRRNEVLAVIDQGLRDFSVSRARVKWGIPVPEQPDHVLYVWVDALSNYVTALGFASQGELYRDLWDEGGVRMHLIGKDIIRFHCLYWPAILFAAGVKRPTHLFVQGHITKNGKKLSKSTGNVIDPEALVDQHGPDPVRYFLLREGVYGHDWDFTDQAFVTRFNADLANDYGNLVSRALTMVQRYCDGKVPPRLSASRTSETQAVLRHYDALNFSGALAELWSQIAQLNQRIVAVGPWTLAKDPARRGELDDFLYGLLEDIRIATVLVSPVMPRAAGRVLRMLGLPGGEPQPGDLAWGRLVPGSPLGAIEPLFPRLERAQEALTPNPSPKGRGENLETKVTETPKAVPEQVPAAPAAVAAEPQNPQITIDEFARLDLRVARIVAAERIPGATKLLKLQVELGGETRQIVAGIAEAYTPEELPGRTVVVVANLKPAKLRGVESQGMLLAASLDGQAVLCGFDKPVTPGTKVK